MNKSSGLALLSFTIIISLMAGTYILLKDWNLTGQFGYVSALIAAVAAVLYAGTPGRSWVIVAGLMGAAIYIFYRSTGRWNFPFLKYILGLTMIGYGVFGLLILFRALSKQDSNRG